MSRRTLVHFNFIEDVPLRLKTMPHAQQHKAQSHAVSSVSSRRRRRPPEPARCLGLAHHRMNMAALILFHDCEVHVLGVSSGIGMMNAAHAAGRFTHAELQHSFGESVPICDPCFVFADRQSRATWTRSHRGSERPGVFASSGSPRPQSAHRNGGTAQNAAPHIQGYARVKSLALGKVLYLTSILSDASRERLFEVQHHVSPLRSSTSLRTSRSG
jgi:hypothetical protein